MCYTFNGKSLRKCGNSPHLTAYVEIRQSSIWYTVSSQREETGCLQVANPMRLVLLNVSLYVLVNQVSTRDSITSPCRLGCSSHQKSVSWSKYYFDRLKTKQWLAWTYGTQKSFFFMKLWENKKNELKGFLKIICKKLWKRIFIRFLVDETIIPSTQQPRVLYWRVGFQIKTPHALIWIISTTE